MPARLSKFAFEATCKQYAHPWSDSCVSTTAGLGLHSIQECLRIYSTLYFVCFSYFITFLNLINFYSIHLLFLILQLTLLTKGRIPTINDLKKTFISIIQSTAFLSWSAFAYSMFICIFR